MDLDFTRRVLVSVLIAVVLCCGLWPSPAAAQIESWTVTTTADEGPGSLREALMLAPAGATVTFDPGVFPLADPATIFLETGPLELPQGGITIDARDAGVILDGSRMDDVVLRLSSDGNVVQGLAITGARYSAITIDDAADNLIGGENATPGGACTGACNHIYDCNRGIDIGGPGATGNVVSGNYLGTDAAGLERRPFEFHAIAMHSEAHGNRIGGTTPAERNLICGSAEGPGVAIAGVGTVDNVITGNFIGTDVTGSRALENTDGIGIWDGASGTVIGGGSVLADGVCDGACNVISGTRVDAIMVGGAGTQDNRVEGNFIGTDATGMVALGNGSNGLIVDREAAGTQVTGNLISGNSSGVSIDQGASGTVVAGNAIGTDATLEGPLGNRDHGVSVDGPGAGTVIGPGNVIAYQGGPGVVINSMMSRDTAPAVLVENAIFANGASAVLLPESVNVENLLPVDVALPVPVIATVDASVVKGLTPVAGARIDVFSGDAAGDMRTFEGSATTAADGGFAFAVPPAGLSGAWVTAILIVGAPGDAMAASSAPAKPVTVAQPLLLMPLPGVATPRTVSTDPARIGLNLGLALFAVLYFGFTSSVSNGILESYGAEINQRLGRWAPARLKRRYLESKSLASTRQRWLTWLAILAASAVIESFLAPGPLFSIDRLGTLVSLLLASVAIGAVQLGVELGYRKLWLPATAGALGASFEPQALGLLMAVGCVIVSRVLGFQPGYIYGVIGALVVLPELTSTRRAGERAQYVLGAIFTVGLLAWLLVEPAARLSGDLSSLLMTIFLVSLQSVFFALPPLAVTDGGDLWSWDRRVWAGAALVVGFLFFHIVLNPGFEDVQLLQANSLFALLTLCGFAGVVTLALWWAFPRRLSGA